MENGQRPAVGEEGREAEGRTGATSGEETESEVEVLGVRSSETRPLTGSRATEL